MATRGWPSLILMQQQGCTAIITGTRRRVGHDRRVGGGQLGFGGTKFGPFRSKTCFLSVTNSSTVMGERLPMTSMRLFVPWKTPFW